MNYNYLEKLDMVMDIELVSKFDAVKYMIRKQKNPDMRTDKYMEELYYEMNEVEREEMRLHVLKSTKTQKIKIERNEKKKEREKRRKEYKEHVEKIEEDRAERNITKKMKALLVEELSGETDVNRINTITTIITEDTENITLSTNLVALQHITRNNFFNYEVDEQFECVFRKENIAWIGQDPKTEEVRYFSKNMETKEFFFLDVIDIVEIVYEYEFPTALKRTMRMLNIKTTEEEWREMEKDKYEENMKITEFARKDMNRKYIYLHKLINKQLFILEKLNVIGFVNIQSRMESVEKDAIFFSSYGYIGDFLEISTGRVGKAINLFATLGLITKVPESQIPEHLRKRARIEANKSGWGNIVTYFTIPRYSERILKKANEMALELIKNNMNYSNITIENLGEAFGAEMVDKVYPNTQETTNKSLNGKLRKQQYWKDIQENGEVM